MHDIGLWAACFGVFITEFDLDQNTNLWLICAFNVIVTRLSQRKAVNGMNETCAATDVLDFVFLKMPNEMPIDIGMLACDRSVFVSKSDARAGGVLQSPIPNSRADAGVG